MIIKHLPSHLAVPPPLPDPPATRSSPQPELPFWLAVEEDGLFVEYICENCGYLVQVPVDLSVQSRWDPTPLSATLDTLDALLIKAEAMWNAPMVNDVPADVLKLLDARRAERENNG